MQIEPVPIDPVPIDLVLSGRDVTEPRLSPDATLVAFVVQADGRAAVSLVDVRGGPEHTLTTVPHPSPGRGLGAGCFDWLADGSGIVYVASDGELWLQPLAGVPARLTAFGRRCAAPVVSADGVHAAVVLDDAEVWWIIVDAAAPTTGAVRLDDGADAFCFDPVISPLCDAVTWQAWSPPDMPWDGAHLATVTMDDGTFGAVRRWRPNAGAVQQPRYAGNGELLCVHDASGWLNVASVDDGPIVGETVEHASPTWGMGQRSFAPSPDGSRVAFTRNEEGFGRLCVADRGTGDTIEIARGVHGQLGWVGDSLVAVRTGARTPTQIVRYAASGWSRTVLAVGPVDAWERVDLPEPQLVAVDHDGVLLYARRFIAGHGKTLVWIHGGPTDQWMVEFRPRVSYWWSRGWDVLVVDPRGTTGHGRAYQRALNGEWGRLDVDDTAALVRHAHRSAWADAESTIAIGNSSGGMTVLGLLADHGDLVAGGIASYPVSDLVGLAVTTHRFEAHYNETLVGPIDDTERYERLSPIHRAHLIDTPLLLFHGIDDPVVPIAQSDALTEVIRQAGGRVEYVRYAGEGHGFRNPVNQRDEYDQIERFLDSVVH